MKRLLYALVFVLGSIQSPAQTATDENEGSRLELDSLNEVYRFKWWGHGGRTYFIQHSDNLLEPWQWLPIVESGDDSIKEWGFTTTGDKFFARLKYWTGPTSDPEGDDFDQDGVPNLYEVQHGNSPFGIEDSDLDGLPDGWLDVHANTFAIYPPTRLTASLSRNQTAPGNIYLNNDTDTPVNYSVSVSGNTGPSYSVEDSLTGTAIYQWEDISATGTKLNTISNAWDGYETVPISGFTFPFYGQNYSQVSVGVNGILTFDTPTYDDSPYPIPTYGYGPSNLIAPLWANLETETAGDIYYKQEANRLIVQYQNVTPAYQTGAYSFQVILYSDGRIEFQYQSAVSDSGTVGIGDSTQTRGIQLAYYSAYVANSMAVAFLPASNFYTISPTSGTVSARSRTTLDGLYSSLQLPFGSYTANVSVTHDGGGTSPVNIAANLTVRNVPPVVAIVYPTHQETLLEGQSVHVTATAVDDDSEIAKVEFYDNDVKIGEDLYATYQYTWTNLVPGAHTLTAKATDVHGISVTSAPMAVQVHADSDQDGMADNWESDCGLDITKNDSMEDLDGDRVPNIFEYTRATPPNDPAILPETDFIVDPANGSTSTEDNIYPNIAEALSVANESHWNPQTLQEERPYGWAVIEVKAGVYEEQVDLVGVPVLLLAEPSSSQGPAEIQSPSYYGVYITSASAMDGFEISHMTGIEGSGVYSGGTGIRLLTNCIIKGNKASYGGGIYNEGTSVLRLAHCTVTGNEATGEGRAIYNLATLDLANSIIWGNSGTATEEIYREPTSGVVVGGATSIIKDGEQGGINENPLLNASGFLLSNSPAINRPATVLAKASKADIHGVSRVLFGTPDLGAEEWADTNADGLPDWIEAMGITDPSGDNDSDFVTNLDEFLLGLNAQHSDSDGDGLSDGNELYGDATHGDTDGFTSNPLKIDTDDDGMFDAWESAYGLNPSVSGDETGDMDSDGLSNGWEYDLGLNPSLTDSDGNGTADKDEDYDGDGMPNGWESAKGLNPKANDADVDSDNDGLTNAEELQAGTLPKTSDTDNDTVMDGEDAVAYDADFRHRRLPKPSYAAVQLGDFLGCDASETGVVISGNQYWRNGQVGSFPEGFVAHDINDIGQIAGEKRVVLSDPPGEIHWLLATMESVDSPPVLFSAPANKVKSGLSYRNPILANNSNLLTKHDNAERFLYSQSTGLETRLLVGVENAEIIYFSDDGRPILALTNNYPPDQEGFYFNGVRLDFSAVDVASVPQVGGENTDYLLGTDFLYGSNVKIKIGSQPTKFLPEMKNGEVVNVGIEWDDKVNVTKSGRILLLTQLWQNGCLYPLASFVPEPLSYIEGVSITENGTILANGYLNGSSTAKQWLLVPFGVISDLNNNGMIDSGDWTLKANGAKPDATDDQKEKATEYFCANNKISNGLSDPEDTKLTDQSKKNEDDIQELNTACAAMWGAVWFEHPAIEKMSFYRTKECKQTSDDKLEFPFPLSGLPAGRLPDTIYVRLDGEDFTEQSAGDLEMKFGKFDKSEIWASDKLKLTVVKGLGDSKYFHAARDYIMENNTLFYTDEKSYGGELIRVTIMRQEAAKMKVFETYYRNPKLYGIAAVSAVNLEQTLIVNGNFVFQIDPPLWPFSNEMRMSKRCNGRLITGGILHSLVSTDSTQQPNTKGASGPLCGNTAEYLAQSPNGNFTFATGEIPPTAGYAEALGGFSTNFKDREDDEINMIGQITIDSGDEKKLVFSAQTDPRVSPNGKGNGASGFKLDVVKAAGTEKSVYIMDGGSSVAMAYADPNATTANALTYQYGSVKGISFISYYVNTYLMFKCTRPRNP